MQETMSHLTRLRLYKSQRKYEKVSLEPTLKPIIKDGKDFTIDPTSLKCTIWDAYCDGLYHELLPHGRRYCQARLVEDHGEDVHILVSAVTFRCKWGTLVLDTTIQVNSRVYTIWGLKYTGEENEVKVFIGGRA